MRIRRAKVAKKVEGKQPLKFKGYELSIDPDHMDKIRATNKRRSKEMERRVTKYLGGKRTPMSGAGMIKADGIVNIPSGGIYLIECKLSAKIHERLGPIIRFPRNWVEKLRQDVKAMEGLGSRFGIFVFHWHGYRDDIIFLDLRYVPIVESLTNVRLCDTIPTINGGTKRDGTVKKQIELTRDLIPKYPSLFLWHEDAFYVTTLRQFKELWEKDNNGN